MTLTVSFQPVTLATAADRDGQLVLVDDRLAGVLVRLEDAANEEHRGMWFVEAAFGEFEDAVHEVFANLDNAAQWFCRGSAAMFLNPDPAGPTLSSVAAVEAPPP